MPRKLEGMLIISSNRLEVARESATSTSWGKNIQKRILEVADNWASKSDQELFDLVPVGNPLALTPGQYYGDSLSGGNRKTL